MSRIRFLFAPENAGFAERLAAAFASGGYETAAADEAANAVVVIWSKGAVASREILAIARAALARRILIPVALGKSPPPASFEHLWPMDLSGWSGDVRDPRWRFVLDEVDLAVRRDVELKPEPAFTAATPAAKTAIGPEPRGVERQAASETDLEDLFAEPKTIHFDPRPGPRIPFTAILASVAVLSVAGAAVIMAGRQAEDRIGPSAAPIIAFVEPENQPTDETSEFADQRARDVAERALVEDPAFESGGEGAPFGEGDAEFPPPDALAPQNLRDGGAAVPMLAESVLAEEAAPPAPPLNEAEAKAETAALDDAADEARERADVGEGDLIAGLAWDATAQSPSLSQQPAAEEASAVGLYLRDCVDCPDMAEIRSDADAIKSFAIGVREVTNKQWRACVAAGACPAVDAAGGDNLPVTRVSYADALKFTAWLSQRTGRPYRLPSETEWNYASGVTDRPVSPQQANLSVDGGAGRRLQASGGFPPNAFGLYDAAGNAWEWTLACGVAADGGDPCGQRIIKGGAYNTPAEAISAATRVSAPVDARRADIGFRVARDLY